VSVRVLRRLVIAICAAGIAGMIVTQIAENNGATLVFGITAALGAGALILVTAVVGPPVEVPDEELAGQVERDVQELVASGADEPVVRELVRKAVNLGRLRQNG
jgi:hypothetical protein